MPQAWRELLIADEDLEAKSRRDSVALAQHSADARQKIYQKLAR